MTDWGDLSMKADGCKIEAFGGIELLDDLDGNWTVGPNFT